MRTIPAILDKCVAKLKSQGKSESSAFAICTAALKKAGKLDEDFIDSLAEVEEGTFEFEELETYLQENALLAWSAPTKRKNIPSSHFFDPKNKKYPYRNSDGSVNCSGVLAAWKMANGARSGKKADAKIIARIKPYRDRCLKQSKKETKSKKQEAPFHKFYSPIADSFFESVQFSEKDSSINIQCLREGKFKHPWYGILRFDQAFFDNVIKNFEADIPNPEIAFDFRHMPNWGAAAWVNKLYVEDDSLMANVTLTERGREALKKKEFRYFSIEYTDDYVEYEFTEELDEKGNIIERETKISHGPTVLGGGLTNRPFMKGMAPVSLSETGEIIELEEIKDSQNLKEVNGLMEKTLEELKAEQEALEERIKELEEKGEESSNEELEEMVAKLEEISEAVKKLSSKKETDDPEATKVLEELEETKRQLEEAQKKLNDKDAQVKKLSDDVKTLSETVTKLMETSKALQEDKFRLSVEKKLDSLKKLAFPSTMKVIEKIAFSDTVKKFSITLSEGEGEQKKDVEKSFLDVVEMILESIPEDHRFSEKELSTSPTSPTGSPKDVSIEDVEKYAEEKKITFEEALIEFSKEGKIE